MVAPTAVSAAVVCTHTKAECHSVMACGLEHEKYPKKKQSESCGALPRSKHCSGLMQMIRTSLGGTSLGRRRHFQPTRSTSGTCPHPHPHPEGLRPKIRMGGYFFLERNRDKVENVVHHFTNHPARVRLSGRVESGPRRLCDDFFCARPRKHQKPSGQ